MRACTPNQRQTRSTTNSNNIPASVNASNIRDTIKDELNVFKLELREELKKELSTTLTTTLREELRHLKQQVEDQRKEIDNLKNNLVAIRSANIDAPETFFNEMSQRLQKRDYLIFAGVPETSGSLEEARRKDVNIVLEISQALGCDDLLPEEVSRLGKMLPNRPRLLRFRCKSNTTRNMLLKKAYQLRSTQKFRHIFINPDLTRAQRELQQTLRSELRRRRDLGENIKISNGQIVSTDSSQRPTQSHFL